jgi:hypothetical protein
VTGPLGADFTTFVVHFTVNGNLHTAPVVDNGDGTFSYEITGVDLAGATSASIEVYDQFGGALLISVNGSEYDNLITVPVMPGANSLNIDITFEE